MANDNDFTVKDYEKIIDDIIDEYFDQHNINFDTKELFKAGLLGENVPASSLILDSDIAGV